MSEERPKRTTKKPRRLISSSENDKAFDALKLKKILKERQKTKHTFSSMSSVQRIKEAMSKGISFVFIFNL